MRWATPIQGPQAAAAERQAQRTAKSCRQERARVRRRQPPRRTARRVPAHSGARRAEGHPSRRERGEGATVGCAPSARVLLCPQCCLWGCYTRRALQSKRSRMSTCLRARPLPRTLLAARALGVDSGVRGCAEAGGWGGVGWGRCTAPSPLWSPRVRNGCKRREKRGAGAARAARRRRRRGQRRRAGVQAAGGRVRRGGD